MDSSAMNEIAKMIGVDLDPEEYEYLSKLGKSTLDQIISEPLRLSEESKSLAEQTQELALANYRTFVETAECSSRILKDFQFSKQALDDFAHKMPKFVDECENFSAAARQIFKEKGLTDQINCQSDQVLSILELPILMQTALNNSDYESALDLFTYIRNLSRKYKDLSAVQNITSEVTKLWFETLHSLFNKLRYDLPLPQCLQVLGYLRRANVVYESTMDDSYSFAVPDHEMGYTKSNKYRNVSDGLQLHFLKARGNWFDTALADAMNDENDKHLRKIVELHRIHLFNILTQHKAIFLSDAQISKVKGDDLNGIAALSCWLKEKVNKLTAIIEQNISNEDDAAFESLMNQCMYLCLSFGRLGADLRGVMAPLFRDFISKTFSRAIAKADSQFEQEMKSYKMVDHNKLLKKSTLEQDQNQNSPPEELLEFYPLAEYCNNILCGLNALRVTAPLCLALKVLGELSSSLSNVAKVLAAFYNKEIPIFLGNERELCVSYCRMFNDQLIPYFQKCFNIIFPSALIADQLGVSITVLQNERLLFLDNEKISFPLHEILNESSESPEIVPKL